MTDLAEKNMENYYEYILSQLMYFTAKRRDIEQHFSAEKRTTYNFICDEQSRYAVALIKNGCKYSVNGGSVSIHLENGESITLSASEISSALDGEPSSAIEFLSKPVPESQQGQAPSEIIKLPSRSSAVNEYELSSLKRKVEEYAWREEGYKAELERRRSECAEVEKIKKENAKLTTSVADLTAECRGLKEYAEYARAEGAKMRNAEAEARCKNLEAALEEKTNLLKASEGEKAELTSTINRVKSESEESKNKARTLENEIASLKTEQNGKISQLQHEKEQIVSQFQREKEQYRKAKEDADRAKEQAQKDKEQAQKDKDRAINEAKDLREQLERGGKDRELADKLKGELEQLKANHSKKTTECESLKAERDELYKVAYTDRRFGVGNLAAFEKATTDDAKKLRSVAYIDICDLFGINHQFGEDAGDKVIQAVIDILTEEFGNKNVFRIRGGQFTTLSYDRGYNDMKSALTQVKDKAYTQNNVYLAFGASSIKNENVSGALERALGDLRVMQDEVYNRYAQTEVAEETADKDAASAVPVEEPAEDMSEAAASLVADILGGPIEEPESIREQNDTSAEIEEIDYTNDILSSIFGGNT